MTLDNFENIVSLCRSGKHTNFPLPLNGDKYLLIQGSFILIRHWRHSTIDANVDDVSINANEKWTINDPILWCVHWMPSLLSFRLLKLKREARNKVNKFSMWKHTKIMSTCIRLWSSKLSLDTTSSITYKTFEVYMKCSISGEEFEGNASNFYAIHQYLDRKMTVCILSIDRYPYNAMNKLKIRWMYSVQEARQAANVWKSRHFNGTDKQWKTRNEPIQNANNRIAFLLFI